MTSRVVVYGGSGALGKCLVNVFKAKSHVGCCHLFGKWW